VTDVAVHTGGELDTVDVRVAARCRPFGGVRAQGVEMAARELQVEADEELSSYG
jgi:hypothetical protein